MWAKKAGPSVSHFVFQNWAITIALISFANKEIFDVVPHKQAENFD